ncbi:ester cyclase [Qipengyuania atrilutea]|uniref:Ester cyclase n=1 Tax=Qipengyuania atrilutea TaxID=2744473 RepID=A0A850H328_9SPHN|nr:ester cyclase [Actirhodobacter atriluteus]NVD44308.1 ester cyclase [Actirhodobacter atriluteus]
MRFLLSAFAIAVLAAPVSSPALGQQSDTPAANNHTERNKRLAAEFYEDLWFSNNTDAFSEYVAPEYVVHDVGDRKNVTEKAIAQKEIADLFHSFGELRGEIDYQIAEGDKVATRWFISLSPNENGQRMGMTSVERVPIINVFRFNEDGKIVEIWNHRHDVDLPQPRGRGNGPSK